MIIIFRLHLLILLFLQSGLEPRKVNKMATILKPIVEANLEENISFFFWPRAAISRSLFYIQKIVQHLNFCTISKEKTLSFFAPLSLHPKVWNLIYSIKCCISVIWKPIPPDFDSTLLHSLHYYIYFSVRTNLRMFPILIF